MDSIAVIVAHLDVGGGDASNVIEHRTAVVKFFPQVVQ